MNSHLAINLDLKANNSGSLINQYTVIMDVYFESLETRALYTSKSGSTYPAKLFNPGYLGASGSHGPANHIKVKQWHRVVITLDTAEQRLIFWVDGAIDFNYNNATYLATDGNLSIEGKSFTVFYGADELDRRGGNIQFLQVLNTKLLIHVKLFFI